MKKGKSQRGAISVFLAIILIPCIVMSGMFVDLSRVKLAQGVATSSADLALNSLMANYDADLSDYYGLMASCQNIEDFYEESAQFFLEALYSQGLSADDAESLLTYVNSLFTDDVVHDLFQMEIQTETKDIVGSVKGASLGESSVIIKDQVVEFMKYRAPVEITSNIIDRLKKTGAADVFSDAKEDEQLVEDKQQYAESEEDFMDAAFKTYKALLKYEDEKMTVTKLKKMLTDMKSARETYREVTVLMVSNLNGTSGLKQFFRPTYNIDLYKYDKTSSQVYSRKEKDDSGNDVYYIDGTKITSLLNDLDEDITDFKNKRKGVSDAATDVLVNADIGANANQYNAIQWWKKVNSLVNSGNNSPIEKFRTSAKAMLDSYAKVLAIKECTLGEEVPADWEDTYNRLTQSVRDLQKDYLTAGVQKNNGNKYLILVNKLEKYSKENINKISPDNLTISNGKTVTNAISSVDKTLSDYVTDLDDCIKKLDTLIDGTIINNPYSLDELSKKADQYHKDYTTWKNNANVQDTEMAKKDAKDIADLEAKKMVLSTNKQEILDLKTRLVDIRSRLKDVRTTIQSMKFGNKKLISIESYNTAYNAVKSDIGENLKNSDITAKASSLFKNKFTPYTSDKGAEVKAYQWEDAKYNPDLTVSQPKFHKWLKDKFKDTDESKVKEEKEKVDGKESEGDTASKEAKEKDRSGSASKINLYNNSSTYAPAEFPSGLDANGQFKLGESLITNVGNLVSSLINMNFTDIRDSLYSTEYVMDMFSYATYVNEGKYNLCIDGGKTAADIEKAYTTAYKGVEGNKETKGSWLSEGITDSYNKTLTNKMINSSNNVLHGAEAEYILYGKENKSNITSAYVDIFEIRYLLNTLSGFQNFWSGTNDTARTIDYLAATISGATSGIVPVPVIKCVAILLLTALETAEDLNRLQKGFQVELYKASDEEWRYSLGMDFSTKGGNSKACDSGLFYSDYIYMFLYLGFESNSASEMYRRIGDLIQANMRKYTGKNSYMLKNSKSYFELNATIRVKPLMLTLPMSQDYSNNPKDKSDWCTFEISEMRGYS